MKDDGALAREVRRIAIPAIGSSLLQTMVYVVDRIMLGRYAESSLAAMQIAGPIEWSLWSVFMAFEVGTIARVGRHVGAGDKARARRAALLSLAIAIGAGFVLSIATPPFLSALGPLFPEASPAAVSESGAYLAWTLAASPVVFVAATAIACLQAAGDTRTPLAAGVLANVVHVALNRVLILGAFGVPAMGMRGAGISTAITFVLEALVTVGALFSRARGVSLRREPGAGKAPPGAYAEERRDLGRVAGPAVLERVIYHVGYFGFVWELSHLGDAAMAANQSLISVEAICFLSADGFGIAAAALVAQKLGAGSPRDGARAARIALRYANALLTSVGALFLLTRGLVLPAFSDDAKVIAIGAAAVPVLFLAQPFMATATVLAQALRGAGLTKPVLGVSALGAFAVRITCTWVFAITCGLGLVGVWMGSTCDWAVRSVVLWWLARAKEREASAA